MTRVVVLDYGSGNVRSAVRMLQRVGADVELTADPATVRAADGLYVPGVGNFHACMAGLRAVDGDRLIEQRICAGAPVLGVCVGFQIFFDSSSEPSSTDVQPGLGLWPGSVDRLRAPVVPHMGWSPVQPPAASTLFAGMAGERFYFVHSYAAHESPAQSARNGTPPVVTTAVHGQRFIAAIEDGPLCGTQFHPEKSGDAGAQLLGNWLKML